MTMNLPEKTLKVQGYPWCHGWPCLTPRKIYGKFHVDIFIRSVSRREVLHGGTWRMSRVPDQRLGGQDCRKSRGSFQPKKLLSKFAICWLEKMNYIPFLGLKVFKKPNMVRKRPKNAFKCFEKHDTDTFIFQNRIIYTLSKLSKWYMRLKIH